MHTQPVFISMQFQIFSHPKWESVTKCFLVTHKNKKNLFCYVTLNLKEQDLYF